MCAIGCPTAWTIYLTQDHTIPPCLVERTKSLRRGNSWEMWHVVSTGWLVTSIQSERERHQRFQKHVIRQKNPSGEHIAELAAHGMASKKQREKETETWRREQEDRVPTYT